MKLRLPHKFQAALLAALASVSFTTLSTATAFAEESPLTFGDDLGDVMYIGDSITHGVNSGSYRWSLFQILADNGVAHNDLGPLTNNWSGGLAVGTLYAGQTFTNSHAAVYGSHAYEISDTAPANCPNSKRNDTKWAAGNSGQTVIPEEYANTYIGNWLGLDANKRQSKGGGAYTGDTFNPDTFMMMIGTNDILTDAAGDIKSNYETAMASVLDKLLGATQGGDTFTFKADADNTGSVVTIWKAMVEKNPNADIVFLSVPTLGSNHGNAGSENILNAVHTYNAALQQWCVEHGVTYVQSDTGIVDVSSATGVGVSTMYQGDQTHPSFQGDLIIAGNVAKAMGYAGRSVGLERSSATETNSVTWTTPISTDTTITAGAAAQVVEGVEFTPALGYTVDFSAVYGNGGTDKIWNNTDAFSITVGDGTHSGTLSLTEAYVKWDNQVLYSRDNSETGNFRIAYINNSVNAADNVNAGYYVWLGDQLIGEALGTGAAGFSGVKMQSTGADATVSTLSWTDAAYAPTTEGYVNDSAAFHLVQVNPSPSHDNPTKQGIRKDITWDSITNNDKYALPNGQSSEAATIYREISTTVGNNYTGAANAAYKGDIGMRYAGDTDLQANHSVISVLNATVTGNVYMQLDNPNTVYKSWTNNNQTSVIASFNGSITRSYTVVYNAGIFNFAVRGGTYHNNSIGAGAYSYVNGGTFKAGVFGGGVDGTITGGTTVTVTGGDITGGVYGGGVGGTINGGTLVTITGGNIRGGVHGAGTAGTINNGTAVVIEGNLAHIEGDIDADTVTLRDVAPSEQHYTDGFDYYRGTIRADKVVLHHYTVEQMLASLETKSLVATGGTHTTIHDLTLTACDIHVDEGSSLTLDGVNTYGNTATYNGHVAIADGTTFVLQNAQLVSGGDAHYSDGTDGYLSGTFYVLKQATDEALVTGSNLYNTDGNALTTANTETFTGGGILSGATFSYVAGENGQGGSLQATGGGTGGDYFVNTADVVYSSTSTTYHAYDASSIRLNGGTLSVQENLKSGTTITVGADGSGIVVNDSVTMAVNRINMNGYSLALTGTLTASSREELLSNLTGADANITTTANITLSNGDTTIAGGVLTIGDSLSLNLNAGKGNTYNISSFKQVVLRAGSTINYFANSATFNKVTLDNGDASISITDMGNTSDMLTLAGETQLHGHKLSITAPGTSWKRYVTIAQLVGDDAGTLYFEGGKTDDGSGSHLTINSLQGFSGTLELKENRTGNPLTATVNTGSGSAVNMKALSLTGTGEALTVQGNADLSIGTLTVSKGSTLTVELNDYPSKHLNIGKLLTTGSGDAATRVEIYATTNTQGQTPHRIVVGSADETYSDENLYSGTLWVTTHQNQGGSQPSTTDLLVNAQDVLRNTTLHLENWKSNYNNTRLLVSMGTDIRVAGIDSSNSGTTANSGTYIRSGELTATAPSAFADYYSTSPVARTFEITGSGTYSSSAYIMGKVNLLMSGSGSQTFTGNLSQFNGSINVTNGTLNLTPNSSIATHEVEVETGGALTITTTGSNAVTASATMHNGGTMNLSGNVKLDTVHMADFDIVEGSAAPVYSGVQRGDIRYENSGYLTTSARYYLVKGSEGSTLTGTVTIDPATGTKVEQTDDKSIVVTFTNNPEGGMFYVNDSFRYDTDMDAASDISIAREKTLTSAGMTGSNTAKVLHGDGTYVITGGNNNFTADNGYGLGKSFSLGSDWTGTVVVSGTSATSTNANLIDFANMANGKLSTVEVKGLNGWTKDWNGAIEENIKLTDVGNTVAWSNGASTGGSVTATFSGRWSGTGTFERTNNNNMHYTYTGDISEWTGKFKMSGSGTTNLTFSGSTNVVNATVERTNGTLNLVADTDVQFNKDITVTGFTNASHTVTLGDDITLTMHALSAGQTQNLGNIVVEKSATIVDNNHHATMNFTTITGGEDATLTLLSSHSNTTSEWNLGVAGQTQATPFGGKLVLMAERDLNNNRAANFNFVDGTMFSGAEVQIKNGTDVTNYILTNTLKLNAANVTIGGLSDAAPDMVTDKRKWSVANGPDQDSATLILNGSDTYTSDIKLESGVNLVMNGTGTQSFTGDLSAMTGEVSVSAGTLTLKNSSDNKGTLASVTVTGGTLNLDNMNVDGTTEVTGGMLNLTSSVQTSGLTVADGTTLKLAGVNELTVNGLLTLEAGATLDLANIFASPVQQPVKLAAAKSGGAVGAADGQTYVLATANEIDLASSGINLQNIAAGYTGELSTRTATGGSDQELILTLAALSTDLIWDGGTGTWDVGSTAHWHKSGAGTGTSTFTDGADVVFESGESTPKLATDIIAGTMTLKDGAVVKVNMNGRTLSAELAGEGTYDLTGKSLGDVSLSEENWTGAVRLKDQELKSDNKDQKWLAALHNGKSWVEMNGFKGYDSSWASSAGSVWGDLTANIRLLDGEEKPAWEFDASASTLYTMYATGDWEGTGEFRFAGDKKQGVRFTGDISGWDGQLTSYASGERWVTFAGEAGDVKVQIARHGSGRLGLIVGDGSETFTATFQDTVSASSLEVKSNATAIISSTATLDSISGSGDISVTSTGTLDLTGACTFGGDLEVAGTLKLGTMGESAFTTTGTLTLDSGSTLNLSRLGITGGEFEPIVLAKGGTIDSTNLQNVTVDFGKQIDQEYTLSVDGSQNLVLTFNHPVEGLIWDNTKNNNHWSYDQETGKNWHAYGSDPGSSYFTEGGDVIFASGVSGMQPQLQCDIVAGTITVESGVSVNLRTQNFTLKAENLIGAGGTKGGTVQKMGPGKMEIDNYVNLTALQVQNGTVVLNADADITTLSTTQGGVNRYITIAKDARVDVGTFNNAWGLNTLTVDGVMNVANTFQVSTSGMVNNITGSGTINAKEVNVSNQTTKAAFSGVTLNIGSGGITGNRPIEFGTMTVGVTDDAQGWSASRSVTLAANGVTTFAPDADKTITLSGVVDGSGALEKGGTGTLTLSGSNTYSGGTTVSAGILEAASASALGNGAVNVNGGTLSLTSSSPVTIASGTIASGATLKLSKPGQFSVNSGEFSFTTGAILDLSDLSITQGTQVTLGTASDGGWFSEDGLVGVTLDFGGQEISNAYLDVDTQNNLVLTFASPENLVWDNNTGNSSWDVNTSENWHQSDSSAGTSTFSTLDNVTFERSSSTVLQQDIATGDIQLQNAAALTIDTNGHDMTVSGAISGENGSIVKNGDGMLVLKGTNTGDLTINDGTVLVGNAGALGTENNLDVVVNQGGTLSLAPGGSYEVDNLTLGLGSNLTFSGAVAEGQTPLLKIGTLNWTSSSSVDLSNVTLDSLGTYVLADVGTIVESEGGLIKDGLIQFVSMRGINGDALAADRMVSLHYDAVSKQLILQLNEPTTGFYWKPDRENSVWDNLLKDGTGGTANWSKSSPYAEDEVVFVNQQDNAAAGKSANSAFFLDAGEDDEENITVNLTGYTTEGKPNTTGYVHDLVFAGEGDTYNLTSSDNHEIRLSTTVLSNFVVRKNTTVNFDGVDVATGEKCVMHICEGAEYNSKNTTNWGTYSLNNEGVVNVDSQLVMMDAVLAHVDNIGKMIVHYQDTEEGLLMAGQMINREEGTLVISAPFIIGAFDDTYGDGILHNEGKLVFDATDYKVTGTVETALPIEGGGTFESVGPDTAVTLAGTLAQFSMKLGAHLTDFSAAVTIQDTTELTAENISASDGRATARFSVGSDLGDHVVMGADTTLDLDTDGQDVYTLGEVHSATAGTDQNLIVRSGVTANVDGNVSLPDGKAQVAGGGKLTIGGAASSVGELVATDGGTAVVELNGATAEGADLVLNAKRLSNTDSTTLQVVNTDAASAKTAKFNIGDATPEGGDYKGKLQYGVGAGAVSGSGMDLIIKDNNVAAGAVLETSFSESAPAGSAANIVVDTAAAKVLGLTSDVNSANKTMVVSGATAGNSLEITGDGNYVYAGELGENLDITYSGDGKQTIEGGADDFSGKVTVDNGSSAAGVLAILNAASVDVTDVTLGTNDKLGVYKGSTATGEIANDGNVTMTGSHTLTAGKGAAMDAVLAMESGSTLDVSASAGTTGLLMGGSVTLNKGVTLSSSDMEKIMGMSFMDSYDLFSGVQAFSYNGTTPSSEAITFTSDWVKASDVFSNSEFTDKDYYVFYSGTAGGGKGGNVGAVYIMQIPEPATSTLSLLALAALAARRRRK